MKVFDFNAFLLLLIVLAFILTVQARATNVKMAWDFRDNTWKTLEFLGDNKNKIKIYTTAEDVTNKVFVRYVAGRNIFAIKDKK